MAVTAAFIVHGLVFSSWLPHIPAIKDDLRLSEGTLGLVLLAPPLGAIVAMSLTGAACARWGSAAVTRVTLVVYALGITAIGVGAGTTWGLSLALLWAGALVGSFDVAMNAQGATVEKAMGKSIMGSFHAAWSLAAAAGAGIGGWVAAVDEDLFTTQLFAVGMIALLAALPFFTSFIPDAPPEAHAKGRKWRFERGLVLLSMVAFAGLLAEGAVADWSAVFLSQERGASPMVAGWAYAVFSVAMLIGRLAGDRLVGRFGRSRSVAVAALTGGGGMAVGLVVSQLAGDSGLGQASFIAGLFILGLGIAVIVPVAFSSAGDGPGIATVSTGGYTGWLLGPAVIGGLGELMGLSAAIWVVAVLAVFAGLVAPLGIGALRGASDKEKAAAAP
ncbi:major facilitator superfamily MFS_1 [Stackebrandtia nassauensis DSM 44728]|uniref:Major facilitator superfamily MFS_1 n=2 Tax=Stackebrandtia TaxID=283810 RepID=D3QA45_STANL|nr:major facilitator superfamily MFS_1 [Stackebrandtia nassauensis DSM 44728]